MHDDDTRAALQRHWAASGFEPGSPRTTWVERME